MKHVQTVDGQTIEVESVQAGEPGPRILVKGADTITRTVVHLTTRGGSVVILATADGQEYRVSGGTFWYILQGGRVPQMDEIGTMLAQLLADAELLSAMLDGV